MDRTGQDSKPTELLKQGAQQDGTTCPTVTCMPPLPPTASERETASSWGHPQPYHSPSVFSLARSNGWIHSFIQSINKYLLSISCVLSIVLSLRDGAVNKTGKTLVTEDRQ